jgi:tripartite-type tricarboxylate transporter receptor subunit TctC
MSNGERSVEMKNIIKMKHERVRLVSGMVLGVLIASLFLCVSTSTPADKYPVNPITIIVTFRAGGTTDFNARVYAQHLPKHLGQNCLVENHPASGGVEGNWIAARSKPDGYTLMLGGPTLLISYYSLPKTVYYTAFEPIAQAVSYPRLIAVSEKSGFKTLKELVAYAKENPKKLLVGINPGAGSHLDTVTMMKALGIEPKYVPFKSGAERGVALAGGHLQVTVDSYAALASYISAKKAIGLGVASTKRVADIPTFKEQGVDLVIKSWEGFFAPKGTPADVLQILEAAIEKTAEEPILIEQFEKRFVNPDFMKREEFTNFVAKEDTRFRDLTKELGLSKK